MFALLIALFIYMLWILLGAAVLASVDDDEQRLFNWARTGPFGRTGTILVLLAWPYVAWKFRS